MQLFENLKTVRGFSGNRDEATHCVRFSDGYFLFSFFVIHNGFFINVLRVRREISSFIFDKNREGHFHERLNKTTSFIELQEFIILISYSRMFDVTL